MGDAIGLKGAGTILGAGSSILGGSAADKAMRFQAKQLERNAKATRAKGTRATQEGLRKGRVLESDAIAQMAAGGGGTDIKGLADLKQVTDYNALAALFEAETQAEGLDLAAKGKRMEGKMARKKGQLGGLSTIMSGDTDFLSFVGI